MFQIKAEIRLRTNVKLNFHKNVGLQWYQWIPDFYNIRFEQNNLTHESRLQLPTPWRLGLCIGENNFFCHCGIFWQISLDQPQLWPQNLPNFTKFYKKNYFFTVFMAMAQILCYKKSGIHWYHCNPTFLWKINFTLVRRLISALIWDISGLWNRSDSRHYREKRIVISRFLAPYMLHIFYKPLQNGTFWFGQQNADSLHHYQFWLHHPIR